MGAVELKFHGTFAKDNYLKDFQCPQCRQFLTEQDISEKNYQLWVSDYANEVEKSEFFANRLGRNLTAYSLSFWLKAVEHENCPETENCQNCCMRFLTATMKEINGDYYCLGCFEEASHE